MSCRTQTRQDRAIEGQHLISFLGVPKGYNAVCPVCGTAFRSAGEWVGTTCEPKQEEKTE